MARTPDIARRVEIAARALEVIRSRGVHRTSMSDIATALEMKRPTLYWYFQDLGEIFDAILADNLARLEAFVLERLVGLDHPLDVLRRLAEAELAYYGERRDLVVLFQLWAASRMAHPAATIMRTQRFLEPARERLIALIQTGIDSGRVGPCDPAGLVDLVLAVADGAMVQRVSRDADTSAALAALDHLVLAPLRRGAAPQGPDRATGRTPRRKRKP